MIYRNKYSKPKALHVSQNCPACEVICKEGNNMAQGKLQEWATKIVEELVDIEAKAMLAKETSFHLGKTKPGNLFSRFQWENL